MPDMASKTASTKRASVAPSINGSAPNSGSINQTAVVSKKVCWIVSPSLTPLAQASAIILPPSIVIRPASTKTGQWPRPSAISTNIGTIIAMPSTDTNRPMTYPTGRKSNICAALARWRVGVKDTPYRKTQNDPSKSHSGRSKSN